MKESLKKIRVTVTGINGKMGQEILKQSATLPQIEIVAGVVRNQETLQKNSFGNDLGLSLFTMENCEDAFVNADVIIDFSSSNAAIYYVASAAKTQTPFVTGTTGWSSDELKQLVEFSHVIPIIKSGNMSLGITLLCSLVEYAAKNLSSDLFDVEIFEMHHRNKKDYPSGTAILLADSVALGRHVSLETHGQYGRCRNSAPRTKGEIGVVSSRGGGVAGTHSVFFAGCSEILELSHRAHSRDIFAIGALQAASWIVDKPAQLYSMRDVLNIKTME